MYENIMDYHSRTETSSSEIACFLDDPITWWHWYVVKDWAKPEPTKDMQLGTRIHRVCETGKIDCDVKKIPPEVLNKDGHRKGDAWNEWQAANPADMYLKPGEIDPLVTIWDHLNANSFCRSVLDNCPKEVEHFWSDSDMDLSCRCKFDAVGPTLFVDWKSTCATSERQFASEVVHRFYDVRLALYRRGFRNLHGCSPEVYVVAIETSGGYKVTPYRIPDRWLDEAEARLLLAVDDMCRFDIDRHLDAEPVELMKPKYANLNLENVE